MLTIHDILQQLVELNAEQSVSISVNIDHSRNPSHVFILPKGGFNHVGHFNTFALPGGIDAINALFIIDIDTHRMMRGFTKRIQSEGFMEYVVVTDRDNK